LLCAVAGALSNLLTGLAGNNLAWLLGLRFITGFLLAGIYPVGMKIAAGWYQKGLGNALGFLIGALVLGTAFPHLLKTSNVSFWSFLIIGIGSVGCGVGGLVSVRVGSARVAFIQLAVSGICCLFSPLLFTAPLPCSWHSCCSGGRPWWGIRRNSQPSWPARRRRNWWAAP
jgi:MFS family permease